MPDGNLSFPDEDLARGQYLVESVSAPELVTVEEFLRFYIATSHLKLDKSVLKPRPSTDASYTFIEGLFAGFTRISGSETKVEERSEVYYVSRDAHLYVLSFLRTLAKE